MQPIDIIFYILILLFSIVIHEVSHGFMAEYFGDNTARNAGRLTLNPIPHIDSIGSVILPAILVLSHAPVFFGWAKPVPYNPNNLRNLRWGTFWVAAAGVIANLFIAIVFGIIIRLSFSFSLPDGFYFITSTIVLMNLALAVFNLVPIPPLDGSKILFTLLPTSFYSFIVFMEQYALVLLLIFIFFFVDLLYPILIFLYQIVTGLSLI
jgi:Zn-dependent protease